MHATILTMASTALLALVLADPAPMGGVRLSAFRGGKPGSHMAKMIEESYRKSEPRIVYPEVEGDPFNWDDYPACSNICTPPALRASGCKFSQFPTDVECMCKCPIFGDIASECEAEKCSKDDIAIIHELGGRMCESVGGFRPKEPESCHPYLAHQDLKERDT